MSNVGRGKGQRHVVSRRDFLRVGSLGVVGLSVAEQAAMARLRDAVGDRSCIFLLMTGGASQFETFDPKPDAPSGIRGPLRSISTAIPGVAFSEGLPRLAERADRLSIMRSLNHDAAPIHETGLQLLQTGRLSQAGRNYPSVGAVVARTLGPRDEIPPYVVLPQPLSDTGVSAFRGQGNGFLGEAYDPYFGDAPEVEPLLVEEPEAVRRAYGDSHFGRLCLQARQLVDAGVRFVTVNLYDSLVNQPTWDCHANAPSAPATLYDYRDTICPAFDRAVSALLDDLSQRGLLADTLVVAAGEFGRTPRLNQHGGRDHWPGVWSALAAGGGVRGGHVIGASDARGSAPADRPIHPAELTASIYQHFGLDLETVLATGADNEVPLVDHAPIRELFA